MADEERDEVLRRLREARERREERIRRWDAGKYPAAAYEAVTALAAEVPAPPRFKDSWKGHIADKVREAVDAEAP